MKNYSKWDLIFKHNASNQTWVYSQLENVSLSDMYLEFHDFQMPDEAPLGEYTVYAIWNVRRRNDVEYDLTADVLKSNVTVKGETFMISDMRPIINLMQYGADASEPKTLFLNNKSSNELLFL